MAISRNSEPVSATRRIGGTIPSVASATRARSMPAISGTTGWKLALHLLDKLTQESSSHILIALDRRARRSRLVKDSRACVRESLFMYERRRIAA